MRLAATLKAERGAWRRAIRLPGTMRGAGEGPRDISILDISATGFLAELPGDMALDPGMTVRVAATAFGRHPAIVVRREGRRYGFAFARPLHPDAVAAIDPAASSLAPLAGATSVTPLAGVVRAAAPSANASLALAAVAGAAAWTTLASLLLLAAR